MREKRRIRRRRTSRFRRRSSELPYTTHRGYSNGSFARGSGPNAVGTLSLSPATSTGRRIPNENTCRYIPLNVHINTMKNIYLWGGGPLFPSTDVFFSLTRFVTYRESSNNSLFTLSMDKCLHLTRFICSFLKWFSRVFRLNTVV
jgi:hypothetical protein